MNKFIWLVAALLIAVIFVSGCTEAQDVCSEAYKGMTREQVISTFGQPDDRQFMDSVCSGGYCGPAREMLYYNSAGHMCQLVLENNKVTMVNLY